MFRIFQTLSPMDRLLGCVHISRGRLQLCQHSGFLGCAIVASFVPTECPEGVGMWGTFGKPLKRAIGKTQICMLY